MKQSQAVVPAALNASAKRVEAGVARLEDLIRSPNNPRTHSERQIGEIARSITEFGATNPILVDEAGMIIAGHGRWLAARKLGMESFPVFRVFGLTEAKKRALRIADNKIAENAGWDVEILAAELEALTRLEIDATVTGFTTAEIDILVDGGGAVVDPAAEELPEIDAAAPAVTRPGDLWSCGNHRIGCGDARDPFAVDSLLGGRTAQMVFTDPPYNVPIDGHASGLGAIKHRDFVMASGEMTEAEFTDFLTASLKVIASRCQDGAILFVCMDWRHVEEVCMAARAATLEWKNLCVWKKGSAGMGTFYRSQHELVFVFKTGSAPHINNFELGQHGRFRTNVWEYSGGSSPDADRRHALSMHPTVKPAALVADAMRDCSKRGGIVLDVFGGSGTTLIAAEMTGRRAHLLEIDPLYVDTAVRRWQHYSGSRATHSPSGLTFDELRRDRAASSAPSGNATGGQS